MIKEKYSEDLKKISARIKQLRIEKGYTSYTQFADAHDFEQKQYWKIEEGKVDFRMTSLLRVLEGLDISAEMFFKELQSDS